ncbi:MAG: GNAT family N-acetyltransferase [Planctomycetaceae bacterium]|nr:GNAT family N-acetyltransferase [Planctomycetaceae bacterium]
MSAHTSVPSTSTLQSESPAGLHCVVDDFDHAQVPVRDRWLRLFDRSTRTRVHHHPDYAIASLPERGGPGWTVTCCDGDDPQGMAIMIPKHCRLGRQVLPGARSSRWGARLAGFGLLGSDDESVVDCLVETLAEQMRMRSIPVMEFEEIEEVSNLWRSLRRLSSQGFRFVPSSDFAPHHRIRLPNSPEEYWCTFKSKRRNALRKERERFGNYALERLTAAANIDRWLTDAKAISDKSWQSQRFGPRVSNNDDERRFLTFLATMGALRAYMLHREGEPVAFVMGHQWKGVYHYDEVGFDRNLVNLAPGKVLLQEILDDLLTFDRPDVFDFGLGDGGYKQFFANEQSRSATLWMFPPGSHAVWQVASIILRRTLGRQARAILERTGLYETLRRRLKDNAAD